MFKDLLPQNILKSPEIAALAEVCGIEIEKISELIGKVLIYSKIDELSEPVLDLLAWQFSIPGYLNFNISKKRAYVKKALELHKYKGTLWAVKEVLAVAGIEASVIEWFDDPELEPYYFKINLALSDDISSLQDLFGLIDEFKNVRSRYFTDFNQFSEAGFLVNPGCVFSGDISSQPVFKPEAPIVFSSGQNFMICPEVQPDFQAVNSIINSSSCAVVGYRPYSPDFDMKALSESMARPFSGVEIEFGQSGSDVFHLPLLPYPAESNGVLFPSGCIHLDFGYSGADVFRLDYNKFYNAGSSISSDSKLLFDIETYNENQISASSDVSCAGAISTANIEI